MNNRQEKLKNIKVIVFDLDGTLLNRKTDLSESTIDSILRLHQLGLKFIIASGRIYPMLESYIKRLQVIDYVISANGASIDDVRLNKRLNKIFINPIEAKKIYTYCSEHHIECLILKRYISFFPKHSVRLEKFKIYNEISVSLGYQPMELSYYQDNFNEFNDIEKILIHEKIQENVNKLETFIDSHTKLKYTKSDKSLLDISSQGVSKEEALLSLCERDHIDLDHVMVFGDYDNDVGMMNIAGYAVAPKNASKDAHSAADEITLSNDDDGVAHMLNIILEMRNSK
ncbi:MAG: Cof-type HAD-IIB family hydrolase [Acholeplasmataceae bacterium]